MKYSAYPKYKASGVEWLGDVPKHWDVKAIKWETPVFRGASPRPIDDPVYFDDEGEYAWVRIADVTASHIFLEETTQRLSDIGANLSVKLNPGKIFLSIAATVGVPCITKIKCCIHDGFVHFPLLKSDTKFMYYIFDCGEPYKGLGKLGTQLNLNTDTVGSIVMGFPPLPEQQTIADFLDHETGRIDSLIGKKQRFVELLKEKRTALISHAVTKGLNPKIKMKPSGVEWLGTVPEHWATASLKWVSVRYSGGTPDKTIQEYWEDGTIPWLNSGAVNDEYITEPSEYITDEAYRKSSAKWIPEGSLVIALAGQGKTKGMVAQVGFKTTCNQSMAVIIPNKRFNARFLFWWITKNYNNLRNIAGGDSRDGLNLEMIGSIPCPIPTLTEQKVIADFLDRETGKIDTLAAKVETAIEKLKEYRTALISAAVTGKIDVSTGLNTSVREVL